MLQKFRPVADNNVKRRKRNENENRGDKTVFEPQITAVIGRWNGKNDVEDRKYKQDGDSQFHVTGKVQEGLTPRQVNVEAFEIAVELLLPISAVPHERANIFAVQKFVEAVEKPKAQPINAHGQSENVAHNEALDNGFVMDVQEATLVPLGRS